MPLINICSALYNIENTRSFVLQVELNVTVFNFRMTKTPLPLRSLWMTSFPPRTRNSHTVRLRWGLWWGRSQRLIILKSRFVLNPLIPFVVGFLLLSFAASPQQCGSCSPAGRLRDSGPPTNTSQPGHPVRIPGQIRSCCTTLQTGETVGATMKKLWAVSSAPERML